MSQGCAAIHQQLLRHEERSCWARLRAAQRGSSTVPRRVQRGGLLFADVVLGVVVVVCGMLDAGLGVDAALRSSASARAASRRSGGDACHPASKTFSARTGRGRVEVEDAPQPPTWRAKCRRIAPGTRRISRGKESSKGLNTESNNPQRSTATVLVGLAGEEHCRDERTVLPRFRALLER